MLNTFLNRRSSSSRLVFIRCLMSMRPDTALGAQMKLLNEKKQFKKALELFEKYQNKSIETLSSFTITQALKACAQMRDLERGLTIHRLISSRIKNDSYILTSLVHLYSKF
jgi:hypothetical protein